jgi:hypothetical protein
MLFQYGGGMFQDTFYYLQQMGISDVIIPFILIFTILYAVLQKINLFGDQSQRFNAVIALAISLTTIIPHVLGTYPPGSDVVVMINNALPEVVFLIIGVVLLLVLLGFAWGDDTTKSATAAIVAVIAAGILIVIFASEAIPVPILSYLDPQLRTLLIVILVFGLVFWYVTREKSDKTIGQQVKSLFDKLS